MKWVVRVLLEGPEVLSFPHGGLVSARLIILFNEWEKRFGTEWENIGKDRCFLRGRR